MNIEFFQTVALSVANERSVAIVFNKIVKGLTDDPNVVLARIWIIAPGDMCKECIWQENCPDKSMCLHLVASDGQSLDKDVPRSTSLNGKFRRFPIFTAESHKGTSTGKIGYIGGTGNPILKNDIKENPNWLMNPEWAKKEKITSFAGQPLIFRDKTLGVLALFSRKVLDKSHLAMFRTFAHNAAAAIANAKAFEEIKHLHQKLELELEYLRDEVRDTCPFGNIIGHSAALQKTLHQIELVAPTDTTVLIQGESGTGKELIALAIHQQSKRKNHALIKVNCASIPRDLFESEFFGHIRGAFTGAVKDRTGRFQLADNGTIFLDEIGDIPVELQSKLLRVLQEGEYEKIGDERTRKVNVRVIAATNRDLKKEMEINRFREDLYFRLSVFPIEIVPLRNRKDDIPILAQFFLKKSCRNMGLRELHLKNKHVMQLQNYNWPGNIRELQNIVERAVIMSKGKELRLDLPLSNNKDDLSRIVPPCNEDKIVTADEIKEFEIKNIIRSLNKSNWKVSGKGGAAELLGMKPTTLDSRIKMLGIRKSS